LVYFFVDIDGLLSVGARYFVRGTESFFMGEWFWLMGWNRLRMDGVVGNGAYWMK
jgi:hypothetical protein